MNIGKESETEYEFEPVPVAPVNEPTPDRTPEPAPEREDVPVGSRG